MLHVSTFDRALTTARVPLEVFSFSARREEHDGQTAALGLESEWAISLDPQRLPPPTAVGDLAPVLLD
jgi:hypothetical protein